jgi:hypothetical protein
MEGDPRPLARSTPYELVFTEGDFESRVFPRILAEATEQDVEAIHPDRFQFLSTAADLVREMTPEDAPPEALEQYRALLYHAYHFWRSGRKLYVLDPAAARYLIEGAPAPDDWPFQLPAPSGYLQLPANLFWSSIAPDTPPEPVDGFFLSQRDRSDAFGRPSRHLEVLMVLGIHRARAGFSVIPLDSEVGTALDEVWSSEERAGGDFSNVLPGGEIDGLYSILTTAEVLKLIARVFWFVDTSPDSLVQLAEPELRSGDEVPRTSHIEAIVIGLTMPDADAGDPSV